MMMVVVYFSIAGCCGGVDRRHDFSKGSGVRFIVMKGEY